jgi:hypothetical protein
MVTLLPPGYSINKGKKTLFVFLLEILDNDGIKAKAFWNAKKKRSQTSREVRAHTTAPMPVSAPSVPPLAPAISSAPPALVTTLQVPSTPPRPTPTPSLDDVAMRDPCSPLAAEPLTEWPRSGPGRISNQAFACKFLPLISTPPDTPHEVQMQRNKANRQHMIQWLAKAHRRGFNMGQVCNLARHAGLGQLLSNVVFTNLLRNNFTNLTGPSEPPSGANPGHSAS